MSRTNNPYSQRPKINWQKYAETGRDREAQRDAGFWGGVAQAAPGIGAGLGGLAGALIGGIPTGGIGAVPGAGIGASIGGALGGAVGGSANNYAESRMDPQRKKELDRMALMQAMMSLRGF